MHKVKIWRELPLVNEALFCSLVRNWNLANDEPGISAVDRVAMRHLFKSWLLSLTVIERFPPPGSSSHLMGIPMQLFEATIASIDAQLILYDLIPKGKYNPRSCGTNSCETYHSTVECMSHTNKGVPNCFELRQIMSRIAEFNMLRINPNKKFPNCTARRPTYMPQDLLLTQDDISEEMAYSPVINTTVSSLNILDHFFDSEKRKGKNIERCN